MYFEAILLAVPNSVACVKRFLNGPYERVRSTVSQTGTVSMCLIFERR